MKLEELRALCTSASDELEAPKRVAPANPMFVGFDPGIGGDESCFVCVVKCIRCACFVAYVKEFPSDLDVVCDKCKGRGL